MTSGTPSLSFSSSDLLDGVGGVGNVDVAPGGDGVADDQEQNISFYSGTDSLATRVIL